MFYYSGIKMQSNKKISILNLSYLGKQLPRNYFILFLVLKRVLSLPVWTAMRTMMNRFVGSQNQIRRKQNSKKEPLYSQILLGNKFGKMKVVPNPEGGRVAVKLSVSNKNIE